MLLKSKKAEFGILVTLIVLLASSTVLGLISYKLIPGAKDLSREEECSLSILAADQAGAIKRRTLDAVDVVPSISCEAEDVAITLEDVTKRKGGRIDDDMMKRAVAEKMVDCWNIIGQGKLMPFQASWPREDQTFCLTCSTIIFADEVIEQAERQQYVLKSLREWMAVRRMPRSDMTYHEYMVGSTPTKEELDVIRETHVSWPLDDKYFVIWRLMRQDRKLDGLLLLVPPVGAANAVFGFATGSMTDIRQIGRSFVTQGIFLVPQGDISEMMHITSLDEERETCTVLVN